MARGGKKDGYILVAVLGVMLLLTSLVAAGSVFVRSALDTVKVGDSDVTMSGLTAGGLEQTAHQLFGIRADPDLVEGRRIKFSDGTIAPHIIDESGKADLNKSDPKLLASLLLSVGINSQAADLFVARIVDFRGDKGQVNQRPETSSTSPTTTSSQPNTLSQPTASAQPAATPTPQSDKKQRRGFQSVDQLGDLLGLSREDAGALRPLLTVYNPDGKINIATASPAMLKAIPGMSSAEVEVVLARREGASKRDIENLSNLLGNAKTYIKTKSGPIYTVRIDAISAKGRKKAINAVIAPSKSPDDPFYVLDWWE